MRKKLNSIGFARNLVRLKLVWLRGGLIDPLPELNIIGDLEQ